MKKCVKFILEPVNCNHVRTLCTREKILVQHQVIVQNYKLNDIPCFYHNYMFSYPVYKNAQFSLWEVEYFGNHGNKVNVKNFFYVWQTIWTTWSRKILEL